MNYYLDCLEGERKEVCSDLLETVDAEAGVSAVVEVLHVAAVGLLVVAHDLAPVPPALARRRAHAVQDYRLRHLRRKYFLSNYQIFLYSYNYRRAVELVVGVGHALVEPLQGEVGGVEGLLQEHVA